jgi:putative Mg2+ transporter-C (MgtC) family protein
MNPLLKSIGDAAYDDFQGFFNAEQITHLILRVGAAFVAGAIIGYQRERLGKSAGLRTHLLVTVGTALMVAVCYLEGMDHADASRVLQGIITGIGFLGGGVILKLEKDHEIRGLTSAAAIWYVAALGIACGLGRLTIALLGSVVGYIILEFIARLEPHHPENA